jgi:23S rRNA (guanosine2251-2'-O)-methyltransferase
MAPKKPPTTGGPKRGDRDRSGDSQRPRSADPKAARPASSRPQASRPQAPRPTAARPAAPRSAEPRPAAGRETSVGPSRGANTLFGVHAVGAALLNPDRVSRRLWATDAGAAAVADVLARLRAEGRRSPDIQIVDRARLDRLFPAGTVHQGLVLEVEPLPDADLSDLLMDADAPAIVVVLDQVTDPHNVGAILRSAAAFGARAVVVTERHAPEVTGTLAKAASGALEAVPLVRVTNLARALVEMREAGYWCVGLSEHASARLSDQALPARIAIVMGSEGTGLRRLTAERCDALARLPTGGPVASLNVSVAAAVALYEAVRMRE